MDRPIPHGDSRWGQPDPEGGNHGPREASSTKPQAGFVANQDFSGFWTVNICREGHSQRSAPQKRHTAHPRRHTPGTPRKLSGWNRGRDKSEPSTGDHYACQVPGHLSCSDLGWCKTQAQPNLRLCRVSKNLRGLDLGSAYNPGPTSDSSQKSNLESEQCRLGKHTHHEWGQTQCG